MVCCLCHCRTDLVLLKDTESLENDIFLCLNIKLIKRPYNMCVCKKCVSYIEQWKKFQKQCEVTQEILENVYVIEKTSNTMNNSLIMDHNYAKTNSLSNVQMHNIITASSKLILPSTSTVENEKINRDTHQNALKPVGILPSTSAEEKVKLENNMHLQNKKLKATVFETLPTMSIENVHMQENTHFKNKDVNQIKSNPPSSKSITNNYLSQIETKALSEYLNRALSQELNKGKGGKLKVEFSYRTLKPKAEHTKAKKSIICKQSKVKKPTITLPNTGKVLNCELCNSSFISKKGYVSHMDAHKNMPCKCDICGEIFNTKREMNNHQYRKHIGEHKLKCKICDQSYLFLYQLKKHMNMHKDKNKMLDIVACKVCGKYFINVEKGNMNNTCDRCRGNEENTTPSYQQLTDTESKVLQVVTCTDCEAVFTNKAEFDIHMDIAHPKQFSMFSCDICTILFENQKDLLKHKSTMCSST